MDETPNKQKLNKWGGLLSFGAGRKRLIIAFCALSIMVISMVVVIKLTPENERAPIIGGINGGVDAHSIPWQVAIVFTKQGSIHCGGSLISCQHVLTAAHCIENKHTGELFDTNRFYIVVGEHNITSEIDGKYVRVKKIHRHEKWNPSTLDHDFAILTLQEPLNLNKKIQTISLPQRKNEQYAGRVCKATGWGDLEFCKEQPCRRPEVLQQVETKCISNKECSTSASYVKYSRTSSRHVITKNMICAGNKLHGGEDACQGDSGGPLTTTDDDGNTILIGVSSWGYGCGHAQAPGVYSKVASVLIWMNTIIKRDNQDCEACEDMKKCSDTKRTYKLCKTDPEIQRSCPKTCCAESSLEDNVRLGNWTNYGSCQPVDAIKICDEDTLGFQQQIKNCSDGIVQKCLASEISRSISCFVNKGSKPQCQDSTNKGTTKRTMLILCLNPIIVMMLIRLK